MSIENLDTRAQELAAATDKDIDPITFSVILNRFNTIAREICLDFQTSTTILASCHCTCPKCP